jgi:hypothetical protein
MPRQDFWSPNIVAGCIVIYLLGDIADYVRVGWGKVRGEQIDPSCIAVLAVYASSTHLFALMLCIAIAIHTLHVGHTLFDIQSQQAEQASGFTLPDPLPLLRGQREASEVQTEGIADSLLSTEWPTWPPDMASLIVGQGYPLEQHWVTTADGYTLEIFRIPHYGNSAVSYPPVLLMHGLLVSSAPLLT